MTSAYQALVDAIVDAWGLSQRSGGHYWSEDTHGRHCTVCQRRWAEVIGATEHNILQRDFACSGALLEKEQREFADEVAWLWSTIIDAASAGH